MKYRMIVLLGVLLAGLLVSSGAGAQVPDSQPNRGYLPTVRKNPTTALFSLRVARVDRSRAVAACLNPLNPATVQAAQICPIEGDYIAFVASNPSSVLIGGRDAQGDEAAWAGSVSEFDLIRPTQTIVADHVELATAGYVEASGFYTAPAGGYTVIQMSGVGSAVEVAAAGSGGPSFWDVADFGGKLADMLDRGLEFDIDWPGNVRFYNRMATTSMRIFDCFNSTHAVWSPLPHKLSVRGGWGPLGTVYIGGEFHDERIAQCMGEHTYVKMTDIMTLPAAAHVESAVNQARRGTPPTFSWVTDATGAVYAAWTLATGGIAYYGYQVINSATPSPATFLFVPNAFLDITCATLDGVRSCLISEGQPNQ